jgi:hypothetical protein
MDGHSILEEACEDYGGQSERKHNSNQYDWRTKVGTTQLQSASGQEGLSLGASRLLPINTSGGDDLVGPNLSEWKWADIDDMVLNEQSTGRQSHT